MSELLKNTCSQMSFCEQCSWNFDMNSARIGLAGRLIFERDTSTHQFMKKNNELVLSLQHQLLTLIAMLRFDVPSF